jgi:DNA (cytosine-5)-methyltransferase 1
MTKPDLTYVDLFAGAGGLSIGLEKAGFNLTHAVEIDEDAAATFANNRTNIEKEDLSSDIRSIDVADVPDIVGTDSVDLVAGGPPCQGFSEVVSPDGSDDRNHLFTYFVDWVEELQPGVALFENVRGMQNTADGKFLEAVKAAFNEIGYDVTHRVVRSSDFGVPQLRRRIVVLATKREHTPIHPFSGFEINPIEPPSVMDGIGDLPELAANEEANEYRDKPTTVLQKDLRAGSDELSHHQAANHTDELVEMISHVPDGGNKADIPEELQPSSGYHNSYSRLKSDEPAVAITSNMSKPSSARCVHPFQDRGLTPREGARLQTFPDTYRFDGGLVSIRKQIGNAVPPYLAESIGYYLKQSVFGEDLSKGDEERISIIRSGALDYDEFRASQDEIGGLEQQITLDLAK